MLLMIDNYDSFTYNLVQLFQKLGQEVTVRANDRITLTEIEAMAPEGILLSPGPCTPAESGACPQIVRELHSRIPILGICLGHQVIGSVFGASVQRAPRILHGKTDTIRHRPDPLFEGVPEVFTATRYHSLHVTGMDGAPDLVPLAASDSDGLLMAMKHRTSKVYGLQFHPESYASQFGTELASNFISLCLNRQ